MKIGIFDSGLGGLIIAKAIKKIMPEYDYTYLGDTKRVPYGNRSHEAVFEFTKQGVDYLFRKENCAIIIVACNTVSARALREIQQKYLPKNFPDRKVLGVLIPTAEECAKFKRVGILGTLGTVNSNTFPIEIKKINLQRKKNKNLSFFRHTQYYIHEPLSGSSASREKGADSCFLEKNANPFSFSKVFQNPAPILVPLAEEGEKILAKEFIIKYLKPLLAKKPDVIVLGCTHYPIFKNEFKKILPKSIKLISQDEIVPKKLKNYLLRHQEIEKKLAKNRKAKILVTDMTKNVAKLSKKWFGSKTRPELVEI